MLPGNRVESTEGVPLGWAYSSSHPAAPLEMLQHQLSDAELPADRERDS